MNEAFNLSIFEAGAEGVEGAEGAGAGPGALAPQTGRDEDEADEDGPPNTTEANGLGDAGARAGGAPEGAKLTPPKTPPLFDGADLPKLLPREEAPAPAFPVVW
jgi:hypothetical protein